MKLLSFLPGTLRSSEPSQTASSNSSYIDLPKNENKPRSEVEGTEAWVFASTAIAAVLMVNKSTCSEISKIKTRLYDTR